jgi:hypothetical protein
MRIAISGAHRTGKSTLLQELSTALPDHDAVEEPYHLLEEDGYETPETPSLEDFEAQLERSLDVLDESGPNTLFDRCPADVLAYLHTHEDGDEFDVDDRLERVKDAMETLDLVVFVPVEARDRIAVGAREDLRGRRAVHEKLEELLLDAPPWDVEVVRVEGDVATRLARVLARVRRN